MVRPRHSSVEAIGLMAGAFVGRAAPLSEKLTAWERLRGEGYRLAWVSPPIQLGQSAPTQK
jgi:hypothetical protein